MKKCLTVLALVLVCVVSAIPLAITEYMIDNIGEVVVYAATTTDDVVEELESGTLNGVDFSATTYNYNYSDYGMRVVTLYEDDTDLCIYIFNPYLVSIELFSTKNMIQLSVDGNTYDKYSLEYISKSSSPYLNRYYKFKVSDIVDSSLDERIYAVSGVELYTVGDTNAVDYNVGCSYTFTGSGEDLSITYYDISTIELDINSAYWYSGVTDYSGSKVYQDQISSVYFNVPNDYLDMYDTLYSIKCSWYEYKTTPMVIFTDKDDYLEFVKWRGVDLSLYGMSQFVSYGSNETFFNTADSDFAAEWSSNEISQSFWDKLGNFFSAALGNNPYISYGDVANYLGWIMYDSDGEAEPSQLSSYYHSYGDDYTLFENSVDSGRTLGKNTLVISLDDLFSLDSYEMSSDFYDIWEDFGFLAALRNNVSSDDISSGVSEVSPIVNLSDVSDLDLSNYYVDEALYSGINDSLTTASASDSSTFLFYFAQTEYWSADGLYVNADDGTTSYVNVAQETAFLDFDIIELTFTTDEGDAVIIPVVASPTDIFGSTPTAPEIDLDGSSFWDMLLIICYTIGAIVVALILIKAGMWILDKI